MEILLATNNNHKKQEIQEIFEHHKIVTPGDLNIEFEHDETAATFRDNALEKALALYRIVRKPVLADDSGLCVSALNGAPGIYSARYGSDVFGHVLESDERNRYLLKNLSGTIDRRAHFVCALALVFSEDRYYIVQETFEGEIIEQSRGTGGFGYDPIFYLPKLEKTAAQLTAAEKNRISHRGKACAVMANFLKQENV